MQWTDEQQRAISLRRSNLLLSAAAGSGKTTVLVERVFQLIMEGANVDELLIVTFSKAAATDMRSKLSAKLQEHADEEGIAEQLIRMERAHVSTIHSFCTSLIRENFQIVDVDPMFRAADDAEVRILEESAIEDTLEEAFSNPDEGLLKLAYGRTAENIAQIVQDCYEFAMSRPDPEEWLRMALIELPSGDGKKWKEEVLRGVQKKMREMEKCAETLAELCTQTGGVYNNDADAVLEIAQGALEIDMDALPAYCSNVEFPRMPSVRAGKMDPTAKAQYKDNRDKIKEIFHDDIPKMYPDFSLAMQDIRDQAKQFEALYRLVKLYAEKFRAEKQKRHVITYTDMEQFALEILKTQGIAEREREKYAYVFVDEYQDVSDVQEEILRLVSKEDNRFMVGDVKQSIYSFRNADPGLFLEKYNTYIHGEGGQMVALRKNFRSSRTILDFVNRVFERIMTGGDAEIEYDENARLYFETDYREGEAPVETHVIQKAKKGSNAATTESEDDEDDYTEVEKEAAVVLERLNALHGTMVYDGKEKKDRPLMWRDFVIIARTNDKISAISEFLREHGVPSYADVDGGFFETLEIKNTIALLTVITNKRRDSEMLAVMRSPMGNFTDDELAEIRLYKPEKGVSFREAMLECMKGDSDISYKVREFENRISTLRELSANLPLSEIVDTALRETGYYVYAGGMPGGKLRQANLDLFCSMASRYDDSRSDGLTGFLHYLDNLHGGKKKDTGSAHTIGEGDDVVRLMTAHKSKGLEFPVVFCVNLGRCLNGRNGDVEVGCKADKELGFSLVYMDEELGSRRDTIAGKAIASKAARHLLNEEMRILYVMLTRAKQRLILVGSTNRKEEEWEMLGDVNDTPKTCLDVIVPVAQGERREYHFYADVENAQAQEGGAPNTVANWLSDPPEEDDAYFREAFGYSYPYADEVLLPLKLTASGLSREITGPAEIPPLTDRPAFMTEGGMTGAQRGTLTHAMLSQLDLAALKGLRGVELKNEIHRQGIRMQSEGKLYAPVQEKLVVDFFESETGKRLLRAERIEREWPFNIMLTAQEALGEGGDNNIIVQGVIDCCFMEDGKWVMLDYKTDRADDMEKLVEHYTPQLALYKKALTRITGIPVKEAMLCVLRKNVSVPIAQEI